MSDERKGLTLDDLLPTQEVRIAVHAREGEGEAFFIFESLDATTLRKYRQLYNGAPGSRRGNPADAMRFVFTEKFIRTEGIDITLNGYSDEKAFWQKEPRAQLLYDTVINTYLSESIPDAQMGKE